MNLRRGLALLLTCVAFGGCDDQQTPVPGGDDATAGQLEPEPAEPEPEAPEAEPEPEEPEPGEPEPGEPEPAEPEPQEPEPGEPEPDPQEPEPGEPEPAPDPEPGEPEPAPEADFIRFVALGDVGKGNDGQRRVAAAVVDVCAEFGGCDFAVLLGDNIYDAGCDDENDPQWITKFEEPYADVDMPFYASLGNHDYGAPPILQELAGGIGIDPRRGDAQLAYARVQDKFRMPDLFYRFAEGPVELVALNTATVFWRDLPFVEALTGFGEVTDAQIDALADWSDDPLAPWRIAFGHHPYISNGPHGNAGIYDGVFIDGLIGSGTALRDFFEDHVIGDFHVLLSGHDHSLQDQGDFDGTSVFVSGAGASTTDLEGDNPAIWQSSDRGFIVIEVTRRRLDARFITVPDDNGAARPWVEAHSRTLIR